MKYIKRIISTIMALSLGLCICVQSEAKSLVQHNMDWTDIVLTAYKYAGSVETHKDTEDKVYITNIVSLYDYSNELRAYYVTFSTGTYAVILNNTENPTAIEYGKGTNDIIEKQIVSIGKKERIVYNNPWNVETVGKNVKLQTSSDKEGIDYYYPDLREKNDALSKELEKTKAYYKKMAPDCTTMGDGNYGFLWKSAMPKTSYDDDVIPNAGLVDWVTMSDYKGKDHCGATSVTNLALYFAKNGKKDLKVNNSKYDTFEAVYKVVGRGPKATIADDAANYFSGRGYTLKYDTVLPNKKNLKAAIKNDRPCGILLIDGINNAHWVVGVGWREYRSSGDFYIRICDNWNSSIDRYYKPGAGKSVWSSLTSYWVE